MLAIDIFDVSCLNLISNGEGVHFWVGLIVDSELISGIIFFSTFVFF